MRDSVLKHTVPISLTDTHPQTEHPKQFGSDVPSDQEHIVEAIVEGRQKTSRSRSSGETCPQVGASNEKSLAFPVRVTEIPARPLLFPCSVTDPFITNLQQDERHRENSREI